MPRVYICLYKEAIREVSESELFASSVHNGSRLLRKAANHLLDPSLLVFSLCPLLELVTSVGISPCTSSQVAAVMHVVKQANGSMLCNWEKERKWFQSFVKNWSCQVEEKSHQILWILDLFWISSLVWSDSCRA